MVLIIIGFCFIAWVSCRLQIYRRAKDWAEVKGRILQAESETFDEPQVYVKVNKLRPRVRYSYLYSGCEYTGSQVTLEDRSLKAEASSNAFWENWSLGSEITVYVNPRDPKESVLLRNPIVARKSHYMALCIVALLLFVAGGTFEYVQP